MKLSDFSIPYPILGINGAFNDNVSIESNLDFEMSTTDYTFKVSLKLDEPAIIELIKDRKASYSCEVDCVKTYYRETFMSHESNFAIAIPRTSLVGSVQFFFSVVVTNEITDYKSDNFNQKFYAGYKFNLTKGHMLAYFGLRTFNANIKYDELNALGSIMEVKVDTNSKFTYYDFGGEKITIFLPQSEYDNFRKSNNHTLSDITHASIVQCALISALSSFKENSNTLWAQTLKIRVQNDKKLEKFTDLGDLTNKEVMEMVSIILDNPNRRMFSRLNSQMNE
jgi:hypothetical protein